MIVCTGIFIAFHALLPKAMAVQRSNIDEFLVDDQRSRKRHNYVVQRAKERNSLDNREVGFPYDSDRSPFDTDASPEDLSALIVDYANMIRRNDVILLDNSVETRTRKRENYVKRYQTLPNSSCACKYSIKLKDLGENTYPRYVQIRNCSPAEHDSCTAPFFCKETLYNLTVFKKRHSLRPRNDAGAEPAPTPRGWEASEQPVSVGCECRALSDNYGDEAN